MKTQTRTSAPSRHAAGDCANPNNGVDCRVGMKPYLKACSNRRLRRPFYKHIAKAAPFLGAVAVLLPAILLASCIGQPPQRIIVPHEPVEARFRDWVDPLETWRIVESQNGPGDGNIPGWVRYFYAGESRRIESAARFAGRYVFVGRNQGSNFRALSQWAENFCPEQDLARLVVSRVEQRFVAAAALYPDDQYGEYFIRVIRGISDGEFTGAVKEEMFWVKREMVPVEGGYVFFDGEEFPPETVSERFEFLILVSIDMETLQSQIRAVMDGVRTSVPPTRDQAAAIANIRQTFFEGF